MPRHGKHALITDIAALKARCTVDKATHCWIWTGAVTGSKGMPSIWCFDHDRGEKRTMIGTRAAWSIAHGEAPPPGELIFRACCRQLCVNPAHLRRARNKAEIGEHYRRAGVRKGTHMEVRRENIKRAWAASGTAPTPLEVVQAIRKAPQSITGRALAVQFGIAEGTVSNIRLGKSHRGVA